MPRNKPTNAKPVNQITYDEFAAKHQNELTEALELLGVLPASLCGNTPLLTGRPPLPMAMQQLKETPFFRLLAAAGRENCPDGLNFLLYIWLRKMGTKIPNGVFVEPRDAPGRPKNAMTYYDTWIRIGRPPLGQQKLAAAMFGRSFQENDAAGRRRLVDRCRKAIVRHLQRLGQNPSE